MLVDLINSLSKEEVRVVKLFLNRTNKSKDRKDVILFDSIRKSSDPNEDKIANKLYDDAGKNAYYRLKNRLLEDINKSLLALYCDAAETSLCFQYLILSRHFFRKDRYDIAHKYLRRSEKIAVDNNEYEILDIIYTDFIKLSQETLDVNPEIYIEKRSALADEIQKLRDIDDILAVVSYRIKKSQNYGKRNTEVLKLLKQTIDEYAMDTEIRKNPVLRFKIYHALSRIFLQQNDYRSLEKYLEDTYKAFTKEKLFNKSSHDTKLQMLTYWTNSLFKNDKFQESLKAAEMLRQAIEEYDGFLKNKYWFFYVNARIINYSILDRGKALEIAEEALDHPAIQQNPFHHVFALLNKAQLLFDMEKYKQGNKCIIRLKLDDSFDKLDSGFKLKIEVAEILFRYEMQDFDTVELLINNIHKEFGEMLHEEAYVRQRQVLEIIPKMLVTHNISADKDINDMATQLLEMVDDNAANETDLINYNTWLRSKTGK